MSSDSYGDCPKCGTVESVAIYGLFSYKLMIDGSITISMRGKCDRCGATYELTI